ncbi:hypothetical protein JKP88DRAFT_286226 [Tribonema minus]|uniref:Uncharacterized protein n=1 Tax=Tribonema minus TaxID=303371 RepID=A0A835ZGH3_9STRA|nr:hypothetical protein JKP88DRAFT_286226 [Tribonema minus]
MSPPQQQNHRAAAVEAGRQHLQLYRDRKRRQLHGSAPATAPPTTAAIRQANRQGEAQTLMSILNQSQQPSSFRQQHEQHSVSGSSTHPSFATGLSAPVQGSPSELWQGMQLQVRQASHLCAVERGQLDQALRVCRQLQGQPREVEALASNLHGVRDTLDKHHAINATIAAFAAALGEAVPSHGGAQRSGESGEQQEQQQRGDNAQQQLRKLERENGKLRARVDLFQAPLRQQQAQPQPQQQSGTDTAAAAAAAAQAAAAHWRRKAEEADALNQALRGALDAAAAAPSAAVVPPSPLRSAVAAAPPQQRAADGAVAAARTGAETAAEAPLTAGTVPSHSAMHGDSLPRPAAFQAHSTAAAVGAQPPPPPPPAPPVPSAISPRARRSLEPMGEENYIPGSAALKLMVRAVPMALSGAAAVLGFARRGGGGGAAGAARAPQRRESHSHAVLIL